MSDTVLLRALGALLIINSHCEPFHPLRQLAFGGLVGDSLFFFLSGFGLALGQAKSRRGFLAWYGRRAARILPSVACVVLIFDVFWTTPDATRSWGFYVASLAGWGPHNPFVGQILSMYVLIYFVLKMNSRRLTVLLALLCVPYAVTPFVDRGDAVFHAFHWLSYFHQMVFGAWLARREESVRPADARGFAASLLMALVLASTRAVLAGGRFPSWFFAPHLMVFPLLYALLRCARGRSIAAFLESRPRIRWTVATLGGATLETYLIHTRLIPRLDFGSLGFPLGVAAFLTVSIVLGCLLAALTTRLSTLIIQALTRADGEKASRGEAAGAGRRALPAPSGL